MAKYSPIGKIFFKDIFNENPFNGYVIFYYKKGYKNEKMKKMCYMKASEVLSFMEQFSPSENLNFYFTINTFKNLKGNREPSNQKNYLLGCNGIVVDIDGHDEWKVIEKDYNDIIERIEKLSYKYRMPFYHYIVKTGRGLQVYYLFKPCAKSLTFLVDIAIDILIKFYSEVVKDMPQFKVDKGATRKSDGSGVFRVPYTYNLATHSQATIERWDNQEKIDINDFLALMEKTPFVQDEEKNDRQDYFIKREEQPNIKRCQKILKEVEKYQKDRLVKPHYKNNGKLSENRTRTCFVYGSFLLHLFSFEQSLNLLIDFNKNFHNPLPKSRLKSILKYLYENHYKDEKKKYLYMTNKTILEFLEIDSGEYDIIYTQDFRYNDLYEKKKEETKEKKREKKKKEKRVVALLEKGYAYKEIASKVGVSISTISRINKKVGGIKEKIKDIRPWEKLGISRATYYRKNR